MDWLIRSGTGYDIHRLVPGRRLILGGVEIPHPAGLLGHSDADVAAHAIASALLGALALGDLGHHYPPADPRYAGMSSLTLLAEIAAMVAGHHAEIMNIDVTVVAEAPRLAPHTGAMRERVAGALGTSIERVSFKATTNEGLDAVGRGEAMAAHAIVTVRVPASLSA